MWDTVRAELVEALTALRQAQGERLAYVFWGDATPHRTVRAELVEACPGMPLRQAQGERECCPLACPE